MQEFLSLYILNCFPLQFSLQFFDSCILQLFTVVLPFCSFQTQRWRLQAEANDEAERLLSSQQIPTERV